MKKKYISKKLKIKLFKKKIALQNRSPSPSTFLSCIFFSCLLLGEGLVSWLRDQQPIREVFWACCFVENVRCEIWVPVFRRLSWYLEQKNLITYCIFARLAIFSASVLPHGVWIFLDQGLNPHPLHGQADSCPLHRQGNRSFSTNSVYFVLNFPAMVDVDKTIKAAFISRNWYTWRRSFQFSQNQ